MRGTIISWSLRLIGPLLFVLFLWRTDLQVLGAALTHVNWWPVAISLALMPIFIVIKAWRWQIIMRELGLQPPSIWTLCLIYNIGMFWGAQPPAKVAILPKHCMSAMPKTLCPACCLVFLSNDFVT